MGGGSPPWPDFKEMYCSSMASIASLHGWNQWVTKKASGDMGGAMGLHDLRPR